MKFQLLTTANAKYLKGGTRFVAGLELAPAHMSGRNVCPWAGACAKSCVMWHSARRVMPSVRNAMIRRTKLFFEDRRLFNYILESDLERVAEQQKPLVRLNASSDLDWRAVIAKFPTIQFYDYTKSVKRMTEYVNGELPSNYSLTFSHSERSKVEDEDRFLAAGGNVSIVFGDIVYFPQQKRIGKMHDTYRGYNVVDGDRHDYRIPEEDGYGVYVGLRLKGGTQSKQQAIHDHFAVPGSGVRARVDSLGDSSAPRRGRRSSTQSHSEALPIAG